MRTIDVGILLSEQINFDFIGEYLLDGASFSGQYSVAVEGDKILFNGALYERLQFVPSGSDSSFLLHDVVIGVNFHWQRCENQRFCGELIFILESGRLRAVNRLSVEEYLVSVISSEMSATSSLELLKAHTIISRSWLYAQLGRKKCTEAVKGWSNDEEIVRWYDRDDHTLFDFCADDHCQRYQGITRAANPNVRRAVQETADIVLKYDGNVCDARFSKCCGGVTERFSACWENEDKPYLVPLRDDVSEQPIELCDEAAARAWIESQPDAFCSNVDKAVLSQVLNGYDCETADFYRWRVRYSQKELSELIARRSGIDFGTIYELLPLERAASGRIVRLKIVGDKATRVIGKELEIRRSLSESHLYSSAFVVDKELDGESQESYFVIKGAGWGHGVGLCQIGAAVMGEKGYSYKEILLHYYPGSYLESVLV